MTDEQLEKLIRAIEHNTFFLKMIWIGVLTGTFGIMISLLTLMNYSRG